MLKALVIRAAGTNCDGEMVRAFTLAGAGARLEHVDRIIADPARLEEFDLIGFPGGFSYGDDIASGRILAMRVRERLYPALLGAIERGCPIIGICNGFQVLVQVGLLPGPGVGGVEGEGEEWPRDAAPRQTVALAENARARFVARWVPVEYPEGSVCVWTKGVGEGRSDAEAQDAEVLPVAHGEGRFVAASPNVLAELERSGRVAVRYRDNYNGSEGAIAGICDSSGLVFGLMPHPDRYLEWNRHPYWTRLPERVKAGETPGLRMFRNAVEAAARRETVGR